MRRQEGCCLARSPRGEAKGVCGHRNSAGPVGSPRLVPASKTGFVERRALVGSRSHAAYGL